MSDIDRRFVDVIVAVVAAVVTWVLCAATLSLLVDADALSRALPFELSDFARSYAVESIGAPEVFWKAVTLSSFRPPSDRSPWGTIEPIVETAPTTLQLLTMTAGVVLLVAVPVVLLRYLTADRRVGFAVAMLGGVPCIAMVCLLAGTFAPPMRAITVDSAERLTMASVALGLPVGLGLARLTSVYLHSDIERTARTLLLEGWLYVLWLPGALFVAEGLFYTEGSTMLLRRSLRSNQIPRLVQSASLFVLPVLAAGLYRDVLLAFLRPDPGHDPSSAGTVADGGTPPVRRPLVRAVRWSRAVQLGGGSLVAFLLFGLVGTLSLSSGAESPDSPPLAVIADGLWMGAGTALVGFVVATTVGLGLAVAGSRRAGWRHLPRLLAPFGLVPTLLLLLPVPMLLAPVGVHLVAPLFGTLGGLATGAVVARRYRYGVRDEDSRSPALAAAGIATTGAALVTFTTIQLMLMVPGTPFSYFVLAYELDTLAVPIAVMFGLPAVSMFVLGEGLRRSAQSA
ncbi:hypothetical protein [Haloarchaeobius baliensis]|uniref:hypothetical protein n=1 Tax=Haloarchaeobius baliensis TaxID=1670458 RepID=UPI003F884203